MTKPVMDSFFHCLFVINKVGNIIIFRLPFIRNAGAVILIWANVESSFLVLFLLSLK